MVDNTQHGFYKDAFNFLYSWQKECLQPAPSKNKAAISSALYEHYKRWVSQQEEESVMTPELWGKLMGEEHGLPVINAHGQRKRMAVVVEPAYE